MLPKVAMYAVAGAGFDPLDKQLQACSSFCGEKYPRPEKFVDTVENLRDKRPDLEDLVRRSKDKEFQIVVVWDITVLGTNATQVLQHVTELLDNEVTIVIVSLGISLSPKESSSTIKVLSQIAYRDREFHKERAIKGLETKRAKGIHVGRKAGTKDKKPRRKIGYLLRRQKLAAQQDVEKNMQGK